MTTTTDVDDDCEPLASLRAWPNPPGVKPADHDRERGPNATTKTDVDDARREGPLPSSTAARLAPCGLVTGTPVTRRPPTRWVKPARIGPPHKEGAELATVERTAPHQATTLRAVLACALTARLSGQSKARGGTLSSGSADNVEHRIERCRVTDDYDRGGRLGVASAARQEGGSSERMAQLCAGAIGLPILASQQQLRYYSWVGDRATGVSRRSRC
jgi:hypothetical protein